MGSHRLTGSRAIALAVLSQAIRDLQWHPQEYWQADAWRWIFDATEDATPYFFTFANCCELVGCDPERLRRRLRHLKHLLERGPPVRRCELLSQLMPGKQCSSSRKHARGEVHADGDH
ncbi:MAG: hypothetical protein HYZ81_03830 [Nitrospinae bacterium]|nr:hypothetical protein [Nitrospinota bacterium]